MLQHGSYTLLIDSCYDREQFPTMEEAVEWTWASTTEEIEAVQFVLRKFFILENGVYVQTRIREELAEYYQKSETNKRIAIERETKRKEKYTNRSQVVNEPPPNHEPITNNHEPITNNQEEGIKKQTLSPTAQDVLFEKFWAAYPNKTGKGAAKRSWAKIKRPTETLGDILTALQWQTDSEQWRKEGGQFIPHPSTYLNQTRWQDEMAKSELAVPLADNRPLQKPFAKIEGNFVRRSLRDDPVLSKFLPPVKSS